MRIVLIASTLAVLAATASAKNTAAVGQKGKKHAAARKHRALRNNKAGQRKAAAAAGLATLRVLERPGFHEDLNRRSAALTTALQEVLDGHALPAIAAGRNGQMPAFEEFLGEAKVHLLAAYVYSLSQR